MPDAISTPSRARRPPSERRCAVNCRIQTTATWSRWAIGVPWRELRAAINHLLAPLLQALGLPLVLRFEWQADRGLDWPGDSVCRLLFDSGGSVFLRLPQETGSDASAVAEVIAAGVFAARASLLTPSLLDRLHRQAQPAAPDEARCSRLARELIERGFRPQRAWQDAGAAGVSAAGALAGDYDLVVDPEALALRVEVADAGLLQEAQPGDEQSLAEMLELLSDGMFYELGLLLPSVEIATDAALPATAIRIRVNELPLPSQAGLAVGEMLVNETPGRLQLLGLAGGRAAVNPANGNTCAILPATRQNLATVKACGLTSWGVLGYIVLALSSAARRFAGALWTRESTRAALFLLREADEPLVRASEKRFTGVLLTQVLRSLLDEGISVRDLRAILEALLAVDSVASTHERAEIAFPPATGSLALSNRATSVGQLGVDDWATCGRIRLARYLTHKYTRGQSTLLVHLLDPDIEAELEDLRDALHAGREGTHALCTPAGSLRLFAALHAAFDRQAEPALAPVILTTQGVRRTLRDLIVRDFPGVSVLCYEELVADASIQPVARIGWP